jgi:hypothetical protein
VLVGIKDDQLVTLGTPQALPHVSPAVLYYQMNPLVRLEPEILLRDAHDGRVNLDHVDVGARQQLFQRARQRAAAQSNDQDSVRVGLRYSAPSIMRVYSNTSRLGALRSMQVWRPMVHSW